MKQINQNLRWKDRTNSKKGFPQNVCESNKARLNAPMTTSQRVHIVIPLKCLWVVIRAHKNQTDTSWLNNKHLMVFQEQRCWTGKDECKCLPVKSRHRRSPEVTGSSSSLSGVLSLLGYFTLLYLVGLDIKTRSIAHFCSRGDFAEIWTVALS